MNITLGPKEERLLMTGLHTVADIYCTCCSTVLGWKYVRVRPYTVHSLTSLKLRGVSPGHDNVGAGL